MNEEDTTDAAAADEGPDVEPTRRWGGSAGIDLSGVIETVRQTQAWYDSVEQVLAPVRRHLPLLESTRRSVDSVMGPANAMRQAVLDAQRQTRGIAAPVLALQRDLRDVYDWHSHIDDVLRSVSLPRALLDQLATTAAAFLPSNLTDLDSKDLYAVLELSEDDGFSLGWAPRTEIVQALLLRSTRKERNALLAERRDDVLDDIDTSLQAVDHPALADIVTILSRATRTARAGFGDGAQALAGNVLETAMTWHGNAWIRRSFPQATYTKAGHHGTIASALDQADGWGGLTFRQFKHYLVLTGMRNAFAGGATQDTFNRHLGAHCASPDSYRPEFVLPSLLLAHALLRALDQDLERQGDEEGNI
ncbi:hypothetical protein [Streptomyces ardesiacus]|uniref:hypothetical protein n=1 Tax=Streptomyces ardesiacus TaxID=285564 RepID=UPI003F4A35C3